MVNLLPGITEPHCSSPDGFPSWKSSSSALAQELCECRTQKRSCYHRRLLEHGVVRLFHLSLQWMGSYVFYGESDTVGPGVLCCMIAIKLQEVVLGSECKVKGSNWRRKVVHVWRCIYCILFSTGDSGGYHRGGRREK